MVPVDVCAQCAATPSGIEGHSRLAPYDDATKQRFYRCGVCTAVWRRSYVGSGEFFWIPVAFGEELSPSDAAAANPP